MKKKYPSAKALFWRAALLCALAAGAGCGTYSLLRPADTLSAGHFELTGGCAVNTVPEAVPVAQAAVGLTDWLEVGAQYETYSALGQLRFGLLSSEKHGIAIALAAGGGFASVWEELGTDANYHQSGGPLAGLTIGRRFDWFEPYLGGKVLVLFDSGYTITSLRAGFRIILFDHLVLGVEGGATFHHNFLVVGEGTGHLGFKI